MTSRAWAASLLGVAALLLDGSAAAQVPSWSLEAQRRLQGRAGGDATLDLAERQRLAEEGESALARGDAEMAERAFDGASRIVHSVDIEIGLVRTYMQAGEYRRALTFAAHAAGAHRDTPAGTALYGWLLHIGGQGAAARRYLDDALARFPVDAALLQARALLKAAQALPAAALLATPLRAAPYAVPPALPPGTRSTGTGLLVGDGQWAAVPADTVRGALRLWLRNGLGQTVEAEALPGRDPRLALLRLASPLPLLPGLVAPPREPFAGSPSTTIEYLPSPDSGAHWPLLHQGFLGRQREPDGDRLLGIDLAPGPRGGPVFDDYGRLAGMALPAADGRALLLNVQALSQAVGLLAVAPAAASSRDPQTRPAERAAVDVLYEAGMRLALQVLVLGH